METKYSSCTNESLIKLVCTFFHRVLGQKYFLRVINELTTDKSKRVHSILAGMNYHMSECK